MSRLEREREAEQRKDAEKQIGQELDAKEKELQSAREKAEAAQKKAGDQAKSAKDKLIWEQACQR